MSDSDTFPVPTELEVSIAKLLNDSAYTIANILDTAELALKVGKDKAACRYNIAYRLWYLFLEYGPMGEDDDLYRLRYGRLIGDIEQQLSYIQKTFKATSVPDTEWTKLTWLIEDQKKIIS